MVNTGEPDFQVANSISGGVYIGPVIQGRDIAVQLPPQITAALGGLPAPSPAFTGRERDIEKVKEVLAPGGSDAGGPRTVLVSAVSGLAGVGKTELAVYVGTLAWKEWGWFPGGVLFAELHGYDPERHVSPEQALGSLLRALAVPGDHIPQTLEDRQRLYRSILAAYAEEGRRILVVIDNASAADQARPLLPADGVNAALVTSRHTLSIDARLHDLNVLDESEAVAMLRETLRVARGDDDTRISQAPEAAGQIARLCAGLPLALSIAASLLAEDDTQDYTAADLADELESEHTRLEQLTYEERAVRAAFDLSYRRLDQRQARLFRLLPLNPGPDVSTEAAAHLADIEELDARNLLTRLARAHLIERKPGRRWGMHDLVRLYADACGSDSSQTEADECEVARARLFTHYQDTAKAADTHIDTGPGPRSPRFRDRSQALQWLDAEHANLIATATAAPRLGHPVTLSALAFALAGYLDHRRYFDDWLALTTTALTVLRGAGDAHSGAAALNNLGLALRQLRRFEEAIDAHRRAVEIYRETGDRHGEGQALNNLGVALGRLRRFEEAVDAHSEAADIFRESGGRHGEGQALNNIGLSLRELRRFEEAVDAHSEAADIFRESGDRHGEGTALGNLAVALGQLRRFEEAIDAHSRAADIYRETGDRHGEGTVLNNLGVALRQLRRFDEAIDAHTRDMVICSDLDDRHGEGHALNNLGSALRGVRRFEEAIDAHRCAADIYRETGDRHDEGTALGNLGVALREVRRFDEAIDAYSQAAEIFRKASDRHSGGMVLNNLSAALREVRRFEEAIAACSEAADIFRETGDRHSEAGARSNLGLVLWQLRRFEEAIGAYAQAVGFYRETDDRHGEGQALGNLGVALREVRRFEEAIDVHSRAAVIFRETGDRHREGMVLNNLGLALGEVGRRGDGSAVLEQAVGIYRGLAAGCESGLEFALARMLLGLARLRVDVEGERILPGALMAAQEAVELFDRLPAKQSEDAVGLLRTALELMEAILNGLGRAEEAKQVRRRIADLGPPRGGVSEW